jgi:hypothetical protein
MQSSNQKTPSIVTPKHDNINMAGMLYLWLHCYILQTFVKLHMNVFFYAVRAQTGNREYAKILWHVFRTVVNIVTCWGCCVTYKTGSGLDDWIYWHLMHTTRDYRQHSAIADPTSFTVHRYTCTRVLSFHLSNPGNGLITVSLSLRITHEVFFPPPNSFLAIIVDQIQFLCSQAHILAGWCPKTRLFIPD